MKIRNQKGLKKVKVLFILYEFIDKNYKQFIIQKVKKAICRVESKLPV